MLTLQMYRCELQTTPTDLAAAIVEMGGSYTSVLGRSLEAQADALGVSRDLLKPNSSPDPYTDVRIADAEILATSEGVIVVSVEQSRQRAASAASTTSSSSTLTLYGIGTPGIGRLLTDAAAFLSEQFKCELRPWRYESEYFKELVGNGMTPTTKPTVAEVDGASLLADSAVRRAALGIAASAGGLLVGDLAKQLDPPDRQRADDIRAELEARGLVKAEFVVICSRNASQVLRAPSRDALTAAASAGATCACGRTLTDERIESAINLDELGRTLLNGSRWMSVLLIQAIHSLGIEYEAMLIEQKSGGDEMDCFADISGELCLFELKDKEFSLGNAYSFGAKVGIHKPAHAIIVTTAQVGNDAKEHFQISQSASRNERFAPGTNSAITYIEGLGTLESALEGLVESIYAGDARQVLRACLPFASITPASFVAALRDRSSVESLESVIA